MKVAVWLWFKPVIPRALKQSEQCYASLLSEDIAVLGSLPLSKEKMATSVVIDADWFVINGQKYLKHIAFCVVGDGMHGIYSFALPPWVKAYRFALERQARFSHGLAWSSTGTLAHDQVHQAFNGMVTQIGKPLSELNFLAKGAEKCNLLEPFLGPVLNLGEKWCPKYNELICVPQTTLNKALVFCLWLDTDY
jgi:hypothetical protein